MLRSWMYEGKGHKMNEPIKPKQRPHSNRADHLLSFINNLPKVESHYCRQRSERINIDEQYRSKTDVSESYVDKCVDENITPFSLYAVHV